MESQNRIDIDTLRASETARLAAQVMAAGTIRETAHQTRVQAKPETAVPPQDAVSRYGQFISTQNSHQPMTRLNEAVVKKTGARVGEPDQSAWKAQAADNMKRWEDDMERLEDHIKWCETRLKDMAAKHKTAQGYARTGEWQWIARELYRQGDLY